MGTIASQITSLTIVYSTVYSDADQIKHQSSVSLAFVWGIHRGQVNSLHKWPVKRKMFPFDDVIMPRRIFSATDLDFGMWSSLMIITKNNKALSKKKKHVTLVAIFRTAILVPCLYVKPLQLIWRLGTSRFHLQVPTLSVSCTDLSTWEGTRWWPQQWLPDERPVWFKSDPLAAFSFRALKQQEGQIWIGLPGDIPHLK